MKKIALDEYEVLFLDDGGVMNNNESRTPQWRKLVAQYFSTRYGGSIKNWKEANKKAFANLWERYLRTMKYDPMIGYKRYWNDEQIKWLTEMFKFVSINPPPYNQRAKIAKEASEWITFRVRSAYPGAVDTIKFLKSRRIKICTSSGEVSWELRGYLGGMGVLDCFHKFYGPDIINRMKASSSFYQKILDDMQLHPSKAIVVDDSSSFLAMASQLGITTIHVDNFEKCSEESCNYHISSLSDIKRIIL
ncbi:MAG: HAD family hydrolase [Promethearchaeota archaeon]|jgi:HAD superfamily hydrolase (TIGR01509 family)